MSLHEEEDFELVLGNRQLFFLAVVLFGVFFSIGYTVGYSRGRDSADEVAAATRESVTAPAPIEPSAPPEPSSVAQPEGDRDTAVDPPANPVEDRSLAPAEPADAARQPAAVSTPAARSSVAPSGASEPQRNAAPEPEAPAVVRNSAPNVPSRTTQPRQAPGNTAASTSGEYESTATVTVPEIQRGQMYLQVLASTESAPAREALREFKAKGHPVALDNQDPEWFRILIGPFSTPEAAQEYMERLQAEGTDSFIRQF